MSGAAYARYWAAPLTMDRHLDCLLDIYGRAAAETRATQVSAYPPAEPAGRRRATPAPLA
jgi:hypothetical protein